MLILASASPRRRELLTQAGFHFQVHPADIPEDPLPNENPADYVTRLAREKALAVYSHHPGHVVLGADTTVVVEADGQPRILGKPEDAEDAGRMLRLLSGRAHQVLTGIALAYPNPVPTVSSSPMSQPSPTTCAATETTRVHFLSILESEIQSYIATGEPMDKAGAYAIQGRAARWIPRIEGCYFNVVGLPIARLAKLLQQLPTGTPDPTLTTDPMARAVSERVWSSLQHSGSSFPDGHADWSASLRSTAFPKLP